MNATTLVAAVAAAALITLTASCSHPNLMARAQPLPEGWVAAHMNVAPFEDNFEPVDLLSDVDTTDMASLDDSYPVGSGDINDLFESPFPG